jgi:hypothetical protein
MENLQENNSKNLMKVHGLICSVLHFNDIEYTCEGEITTIDETGYTITHLGGSWFLLKDNVIVGQSYRDLTYENVLEFSALIVSKFRKKE